MAIDTALLSQLGILQDPSVSNSGSSASGSSGSSASGSASAAAGALGQQDFLNLMVAQLQNQDPFQPLQSGQFLSQMAQFGTVSGIGDLQNSFSQLASSLTSNQGLQAATLVGHGVAVPSGQGILPAQGAMKAALDVPAGAADVAVDITDASGQVVKHLDLGAQPGGLTQFSWDGSTDAGGQAAPGSYTIKATASVDGQQTALTSYAIDTVDSVTLDNSGQGPSLNLNTLGQVPLSQVKQII